MTLRVCTQQCGPGSVYGRCAGGPLLYRVEVAACLLVSLHGHDTLHLGFILTASAPDWKMTGPPWTRTPTPPPVQYLADISCQELWNENFTHLNLILYSFFAFIQVWLQQPSDSLTPVD